MTISQKTHCRRGHEFTVENTGWNSLGHRKCTECNRISMRKSNRNRHFQRKYQMTVEDYDFLKQKGCAICKTHEGTMHIDHNHETKEIRDILCHNCNTGLGFFRENIEFLQEAIKYLEKHTPGICKVHNP